MFPKVLSAFVVATLFTNASFGQFININITSNNGPNPNVALDGRSPVSLLAPLQLLGSGVWNDLPSVPTGSNLVDIFGVETAIDVTWDDNGADTLPFSFSMSLGSGNAENALDLTANYLAANTDFGQTPVEPSRITFSDLDPLSIWDLYFVSQGDAPGQGGTFTIGNETRTSAGSLPGGVDPFGEIPNGSTFIEGENFVVFERVFPNADGEIVVTLDHNGSIGGDDGFQILNGIQLVQTIVEEPNACDVNADGVCNSTDFAILRDNLFQFDGETSFAGRVDGDLNGDAVVDFFDYRLFKDDPLRIVSAPPATGVAAAATVPEPAAVGLLVSACWLFVLGHRLRGTGF